MKLVRLTTENLKEVAEEASKILTEGGMILYPTDTLYGLGVEANNVDALIRLKELKGRDAGKPISILVKDEAMIREYGIVPVNALKILSLMPGALTLVLKATEKVPKELNPLGEIGVRIPESAFCHELMKERSVPITATSANISGEETKHSVEEILLQFGEKAESIDLVIDGGELSGIASTIVSCIGEEVEILREGALSKETLKSLV